MKKKGFTLIELLAVIVILAIIALIAVPVILNVIEKSKIGAAEQSAQGYVDAVEKQIVTNKVKNENLIEEGEYTKAQLDEKNVKIKGEITDAVVVVGEKGRVTQARFCINGYSIDYDGKKASKNSEANYCNEMGSILNTCPYEINQVFNFDYTGNVQTFNAECEGNYKLEVWGAQGGTYYGECNNNNKNNKGGYGGYAVGVYEMNSESSLYIYVGGQGDYYSGCTGSSQTKNGGWNGGGGITDSSSSHGGSTTGGGATDIRTSNGDVQLDNTYHTYYNSTTLSSRIIVAGGGGGAGGYNTYSAGIGGHGGGYYGGYPLNASGGTYYTGTTATQSSAGSRNYRDSYGTIGNLGVGGSGVGDVCCGHGGGGGYYGGMTGSVQGSAGGGSGYIGGVISAKDITKQMYMYNQGCTASNDETTKTTCTTNVSETPTSNYAKQGNGYARITYLGK